MSVREDYEWHRECITAEALAVRYVSAMIPISRELIEPARPMYGPPIPRHLALRRDLGGHPAGRYRRAS